MISKQDGACLSKNKIIKGSRPFKRFWVVEKFTQIPNIEVALNLGMPICKGFPILWIMVFIIMVIMDTYIVLVSDYKKLMALAI